jgi:hypothetical protein
VHRIMFILSMKQINTKEDLFFGDVADKEQLRKFKEHLFNVNKDLFFRYQQEITKERDEDNNFILHTKLGIFKTLQNARDYFNQMTDSQESIRLESRAWNQQHQILSKTEIIDLSNNSKTMLLNCVENVCERFGGKCNEETGCSTVPFAREYKNKKQFPIKVVVG